jgi:hypothetical protein
VCPRRPASFRPLANCDQSPSLSVPCSSPRTRSGQGGPAEDIDGTSLSGPAPACCVGCCTYSTRRLRSIIHPSAARSPVLLASYTTRQLRWVVRATPSNGVNFFPYMKLLGWSKYIFIPKTQLAPAVFLFSFPTRGSHNATSVVWTSLGPLPRWVPEPTTRWAPGTTRLALHGT